MKCIRRLPDPTSRKVHSYSVVESIYTIISELLRNSIQAGSSEVKIILDLESLSIAVADNGNGFPLNVLELLREYDTVDHRDAEGSLQSISSLCAYLMISSHKHGEQDRALVMQRIDNEVFKLFMLHFGVLGRKEGSVVMACRLFNDLPVRAQITRSISKTQLKKELKQLILVCLFSNTLVKVSVSFLREEPFLTSGGVYSSFSLYDAMYPNHIAQSIELENEKIKVKGFCAWQTRGEIRLQLVLWDNVLIELTKNKLKALNDSIKTSIPKLNRGRTETNLNFSLCVHSKSPMCEFPIKEVLNILSGNKAKTTNTASHFIAESLNLSEVHVELNGQSVGTAEIISQISNQLILVRIGGEIFFVDQHACDERIQYEMLFEHFVRKAADSSADSRVKLEKPIPFDITDDDKKLLELFSEVFSSLGISYFYEQTLCHITHLPFCMRNCTAADGPSISGSLLSFANRTKPTPIIDSKPWYMQLQHLPSCILAAIALVACRLSIKFGQPLEHQELSYLIKNLSKCHFPFHCAHGRPTIIPAAQTDLGTFNEDLHL